MNRLALLTLPALFTAACGTAFSDEYQKPVATLRGAITSSSVSTPSEVRVALVWETVDNSNKSMLKVAQELGVRAEFPVRFKMDVTALPPEAAMTSVSAEEATRDGAGPGAFRYARGTLLAYEDLNGNGVLDLLPVDATNPIDRPLGAPSEAIMYIEGTPPQFAAVGQPQLSQGFNILVYDVCNGGTDFCTPSVTVRPIDTEIAIALTADPALSAYLCQSSLGAPRELGADGGGSAGGAAKMPAPAGAQINCATDGRSYTWTLCPADAPRPLCGDGPECSAGYYSLDAGAAPPAGWPCTTT